MSQFPIVVAITGASGAIYGRRLLEVLAEKRVEVLLTMSGAATEVIEQELGLRLDLREPNLHALIPNTDLSTITYCDHNDYFSPIASGSSRTGGMVICPCSGSTLSGIATGASRNLIHRAADVHLKEKRPLILVPRETPLSLIYLNNLKTAAEAGATILPAMPGFYHGESTINELVDFIVARILDQLNIEHQLSGRWAEERGSANA